MLVEAASLGAAARRGATSTGSPATGGLLYSVVTGQRGLVLMVEGRSAGIRFIGIATTGAVAYSIALPLFSLFILVMAPVERDRLLYAVAASAVYVPLQVWLVLSATRGAQLRGRGLALAVVAAMTIGMVPVIGIPWLGTSYVLAALVLLMMRPPWGALAFATLAAAAAPLTVAFDRSELALYYTLGVPMGAVPLAVVVALIRAARELQEARLVLAEEAVVRERLRIDDELRRTIGDALEQIASRGDRLATDSATDADARAGEIQTMVGAARRTLADARQLVSRYREPSLRAEVETAMTLLSAAGFRVEVALALDRLPSTVDESGRAALRRDVARLLRQNPDRTPMIATVNHRDGQIRIEQGSAATCPATTGVTVE